MMPTRANFRYRSAIRALDRCMYDLIARRRRDGGASDGNIVAQLIDHRDPDGSPMPDVAIRDELVTLFLAAYETTAAVLAWTLYLISTHREVEARVKAELRPYWPEASPAPKRQSSCRISITSCVKRCGSTRRFQSSVVPPFATHESAIRRCPRDRKS